MLVRGARRVPCDPPGYLPLVLREERRVANGDDGGPGRP